MAQRELEAAVERGNPSAGLLDDLGTVLDLRGNAEQAVAFYTKALQTAPADPQGTVRNKRGWVYATTLKEFDRARDDFATAARLEPHGPAQRRVVADAHTGLGYLHARANAPADALQEAVWAVTALQGKGVDHYVIRHNLACVYAELSKHDEARQVRYQDLAMNYLREALERAGEVGARATELQLIAVETAFPRSLKERADFKDLIRK